MVVGRGLGIDGKFGQHARLADEQLVDVIHGGSRYAVDGGDVVAFLDLHARLGKGRTEFLAIRRAGQDFVDAVEARLFIAAQLGTQQSHVDTLRLGILAGVDIGVSAGQFGNHRANEVVQVEARLDVGQHHGILLLDGFPVHAVHVLHIEAVAVGTPSLVEDLRPFLLVVYRGYHVAQVYLVVQCYLARREFAHPPPVRLSVPSG